MELKYLPQEPVSGYAVTSIMLKELVVVRGPGAPLGSR